MARNSRSTFRRGISESQRRKKAWIDMNTGPALGFDGSCSQLTTQALVAPGAVVAALTFPSSLNQGFAESTLLRIRGTVAVPKSNPSSVGNSECVAFGIGIISEQAAQVLTAIPNPATASGYDWDGWLFLRQNFTAVLDPAGEIVDIKAMRKWKSGDSIVFVLGMATDKAAGMAQVITQFSLRGLLLLP